MKCPTASLSWNRRRASDWLTIITSRPRSRSCSVNPRPWRMGTPRARKYSGVTARQTTVPWTGESCGRPSICCTAMGFDRKGTSGGRESLIATVAKHGGGAQALFQFLGERQAPLGRWIPLRRKRERGRQDLLCLHAQRYLLVSPQGAQQESGGTQQSQRECKLGHNQRLSESAAPAGYAHAEYQPARQGTHKCERQDTRIQRRPRQLRNPARRRVHEYLQQHVSQCQAAQPAQDGQQQALRYRLADQTHSSRAQSHTHRQFTPPRLCAGHQ